MAQVEDMYFRPPSEADSYIIRVMRGCPHNKCTFCNMFKGVPFKNIPIQEILQDIDENANELPVSYLEKVQSMYLEGGDPFALPTKKLLAVMKHAKARFPALNRFACYGTARFICKKSQEELNSLGQAGMRRVFVGLESGCNEILERIKKGCTREEIIAAGRKLKTAGIEVDVSIMLGIGGEQLTKQSALETADLLNKISPNCVRIRTFAVKGNTEMGDEYLEGTLQMLSPHAVIQELRLMVENITSQMQLLSEHWTNFIHFDKAMPNDKIALLEYIDLHLSLPDNTYREIGISNQRG